jgi:hypothetical protein
LMGLFLCCGCVLKRSLQTFSEVPIPETIAGNV